GDSGGPMIVSIPDAGQEAFRVGGILSAGPAGYCENGSAYYAALTSSELWWIEAEFGIDVTPCGDAYGNWSPGPGCLSWNTEVNEPVNGHPSSTCGEAGARPAVDVSPPVVSLVCGIADEDAEDCSSSVRVEAVDEEVGISLVTVG